MAPAFAPQRLVDAGSGPGGGSWAALDAFPSLASVTWLDASPPFLALAGRLGASGPPPLQGADARKVDLTANDALPTGDLLMASYALAEIPEPQQAPLVRRLWAANEGILALIEPGTPAGYARLLAARDVLIAESAAILAPCPHHAACPLVGQDWCHFSVRLPRSRDHRLAKGAEVPFEDEKFAYLIAARPTVAAQVRSARVLRPPRAGKPGIDLRLCTPEGAAEARFVARRDKAAHARARRLDWGDVFGTD
jgi:ribosomal protein RSM22 (predicted rRNA methylase)